MPVNKAMMQSIASTGNVPSAADVIAVGAGLAGYCAALEAANSDARVVLLEKQAAAGGSSVLSGGFMAFGGTPIQAIAGIHDDDALLFQDLRAIRSTFGTHPACNLEKHEILLAHHLGAIIVNQQGKRFVDESRPYKHLGDARLQQSDCLVFQIFDQQVMAHSAPGVALFDFQQALDRSLLKRADTFDELAYECRLDAAVLRATVGRYNAGIDAGNDEFGREGLCHNAGVRTYLDQAPFYAYLSTTALLATYCGLHIDAQTRVINVDGEVIAGLYAAGEVAGGFHGLSYVTGTARGKAAIFDRIAGRNAALRGA